MRRIVFAILVFLLLLVAPTALAQDAPSTTPPITGEFVINVFTAIGGLIAAFAAGGIVGIAGLSLFIQRLRNDTATLNAIEGLYRSISPEGMAEIRKLVELWIDAGEVLDVVTDLEPNTPPTQANEAIQQYKRG